MNTQKARKTILFLSFFLFLIFCNYISPTLMVEGAANNVSVSSKITEHELTKSDMRIFADQLLEEQLEKYHIAGAAISVVKDGQIIFENGYGFYDKDRSKKVSPETTLFKIASVTKLFTWTAVMQLVEQGKIDLDEDVNHYLKEFKVPEAFGKPITMRNLMTHTAGFDDRLTNLFNPPDSSLIPLETYLKDTMPERIYPPGEIIAYSNYGAALAGYIVEQISGQKYEDYINENILNPLGMNHTIIEQPVSQEYLDHASLGFIYRKGEYKGYRDALTQLVPSGAISSTADDMAKFMIAHLEEGRLNNIRILNKNTAEEMHSRQFTSDEMLPGLCLGFMEWQRNGKRIIWHSGGSQLFKSLFMLIPGENVGLFVS